MAVKLVNGVTTLPASLTDVVITLEDGFSTGLPLVVLGIVTHRHTPQELLVRFGLWLSRFDDTRVVPRFHAPEPDVVLVIAVYCQHFTMLIVVVRVPKADALAHGPSTSLGW
jgi:hypothetical protein